MGYFVDFVPYKYQTKSKLSHKYLKTKNSARKIYQKYRFRIRNIVSVSNNQYCPALPQTHNMRNCDDDINTYLW